MKDDDVPPEIRWSKNYVSPAMQGYIQTHSHAILVAIMTFCVIGLAGLLYQQEIGQYLQAVGLH